MAEKADCPTWSKAGEESGSPSDVAESVLSLSATEGLSHTLLTTWLLLSDDADFFVVVFSILPPLAVYFFQD